MQHQILQAAQKMAEAQSRTLPGGDDNIAGGMSRYGLGAIIAAVEGDCACKACQLLRQAANHLTMTLLKQAGEVAAAPQWPAGAPPDTRTEGGADDAQRQHSPPGAGPGP